MAETPFNTVTVRELLFIIASEFETSDSAKLTKIDKIIELQSNKINRSLWDSQADEGNALLVAHYLTISPNSSYFINSTSNNAVSTEMIKRKKVGNVLEIEYMDTKSRNTKLNNSLYSSSAYGIQYQILLDSISVGVGFCI